MAANKLSIGGLSFTDQGLDVIFAWDNALQEVVAFSSGQLGVSFFNNDAGYSTGGSGTVTSVAATQPAAGLTISGSPITTSGTLTFALANDLAALEGLSSTGFAARTASDTWAQRSLTAPVAGITITNPAGVAGNPTFALADDLAALEALSGTDTIYYRSGASTWTAVTIGPNLTFSGGTLSASAYTDEMAQDAIGAMISAEDFQYTDGTPLLNAKTTVEIKVLDDATTITTGDGKYVWVVPSRFNNRKIIGVFATITTVSSSGTPTVQLHNITDAVDILSTAITIDANEYTSDTAATPPVINTSNDDLATGDRIRIDVDVAGTGAKGLSVGLIIGM